MKLEIINNATTIRFNIESNLINPIQTLMTQFNIRFIPNSPENMYKKFVLNGFLFFRLW